MHLIELHKCDYMYMKMTKAQLPSNNIKLTLYLIRLKCLNHPKQIRPKNTIRVMKRATDEKMNTG